MWGVFVRVFKLRFCRRDLCHTSVGSPTATGGHFRRTVSIPDVEDRERIGRLVNHGVWSVSSPQRPVQLSDPVTFHSFTDLGVDVKTPELRSRSVLLPSRNRDSKVGEARTHNSSSFCSHGLSRSLVYSVVVCNNSGWDTVSVQGEITSPRKESRGHGPVYESNSLLLGHSPRVERV